LSTKPNPAKMDFSSVNWEKSPASGGNNDCMEFGKLGDLVAVRDSKRPEDTPQLYTRGEIRAMLSGAKSGFFDKYAVEA